LNWAQPARMSIVEQSTGTLRRADHHHCMTARLRICRALCP
jgi:hypothetical protein